MGGGEEEDSRETKESNTSKYKTVQFKTNSYVESRGQVRERAKIRETNVKGILLCVSMLNRDKPTEYPHCKWLVPTLQYKCAKQQGIALLK